MTKVEVAKEYIKFLSEGEVQKVVDLFSADGQVESPLYGNRSAKDFYLALANDTSNSELRIKGIYSEEDKNEIALYFNYKWTKKDGSIVEFDVVDILEFNSENKITKLKIIYDTYGVR